MPRRAAAGMVARSSARPMSPTISNVRRRYRSTHTPAKRPTRREGAVPTAARRPISAGVALSVMAAMSGSARLVRALPNREIVCPTHSFMKSAWRQSVGARSPAVGSGGEPDGMSGIYDSTGQSSRGWAT
jgi:hypothetical protein